MFLWTSAGLDGLGSVCVAHSLPSSYQGYWALLPSKVFGLHHGTSAMSISAYLDVWLVQVAMLPSLKLTAKRIWKWMVGIRWFPLGNPLFSGAMFVWGGKYVLWVVVFDCLPQRLTTIVSVCFFPGVVFHTLADVFALRNPGFWKQTKSQDSMHVPYPCSIFMHVP